MHSTKIAVSILIIIIAVLFLSVPSFADSTHTTVNQHYYYDVDNTYNQDYGPKTINNSTFDDSRILSAIDKFYDNVAKYNLHSMANTESSATIQALRGLKGFRQTLRFSTDTNYSFVNYGAGVNGSASGWNAIIGVGFDRVTNDKTLYATGSIFF